MLKKISIYTFTTTTGQTKGSHVIPETKAFPFPYKENYESYNAGDIPKFHSDQKGSFEVYNKPGHGLCLRQIIRHEGYMWPYNSSIMKPLTVFGDQDWIDYSLNADVLIDGGNVEIGGRFESQNQLTYGLILNDSGAWNLHFKKDVLASGSLKGFNKKQWYHLRIDLNGEVITIYINGKQLTSVKSKYINSGMAFLASSYNQNCFDNVSVSPLSKKLKK